MDTDNISETTVELGSGVRLKGLLARAQAARGLIVFVHASGSSRFTARNNQLAQYLRSKGFATLLLDLLTTSEDQLDSICRELRFNAPLLSERLLGTLDWIAAQDDLAELPIGLFAAGAGAAAALTAAAAEPAQVGAIVCRSGRPDLAERVLEDVHAPTLFIVGGEDLQVLRHTRAAMERIPAETRLIAIEGATHMLTEPGALEQAVRRTAEWFAERLRPRDPIAPMSSGRGRPSEARGGRERTT